MDRIRNTVRTLARDAPQILLWFPSFIFILARGYVGPDARGLCWIGILLGSVLGGALGAILLRAPEEWTVATPVFLILYLMIGLLFYGHVRSLGMLRSRP
jgi:hypothetical protein